MTSVLLTAHQRSDRRAILTHGRRRRQPVLLLRRHRSAGRFMLLYRLRLRRACPRTAGRGRVRARVEPQLELRPLAARVSALSVAGAALHGEGRSCSRTASSCADPATRRGVPRAPGRARLEAIETAVEGWRARGRLVAMFPEGTRRRKGCARSTRRAALGRGADRARGRRAARARRHRRDRAARAAEPLRVAYGPPIRSATWPATTRSARRRSTRPSG